jgi:2-aminoadipate transaminase
MNKKIRQNLEKNNQMGSIFSDRISNVPRSFIREILKVTIDRSIISFAGGLPNRELFPAEELKQATLKVFETFGSDILQYSNSEGFVGLRKMIAKRYHDKKNLNIRAEDILITNGSQQGLDLLGKIFVNEGEPVIIDEPAYLGAIQAFSIFRPRFCTVPLTKEGMDITTFKSVMSSFKPKLIYTVPNFQNPSGISYSRQNRYEIAEIINGTSTLLIEDDPYGELRYTGQSLPSFKSLIPDNTIMLGSFSKTVVPGFRLGWIVASDEIMDKLIIVKQASDLHTSQFTQYIVYQYMQDNNLDVHIKRIREAYGAQLKVMADCIDRYFPDGVSRTNPQGGMFIWVELPVNTSSRDLLDLAMKEKVIFVPGDQFYVNRNDTNTMRLNFSCSDEETTREGIRRLGGAIERLLK